ncbi:response regulator [Burkholderia sp. Ax-1719]|jgi:CheY-like chemotaxis protein|uniref:response regulator n=1 Tax=Burkholderia sp. Ax-1719 TaxID=2608334 RepID=UPI00141E10F7|nr:response regulator [Burkholderia sp. Ax-1719]NIE67721.1 response regulator [Burkholderia sp. Ax-1719]
MTKAIQKAIQPLSWPTTAAFVDDSAAFLSNLSLQLDPELAFRLFSSPTEALRFLNGRAAVDQPASPIFSPYLDRTEENDAHQVIAMRVDAIRSLVHRPARFESVSVVVVDYDMPELNGIEFCRRLTNPALKKIVLTGKADEHVAVKSFNEGVIDRFIRKHEVDAVETLNQTIRDMQAAFFDKTCGAVLDALAVSEYAFLKDDGLAKHVQGIFETLGIVEHYLSYQPHGLLMFDAQGTAYLLILHTDESLRGVREIAVEQGAPASFLAELNSHRGVPYFWRTEGYYPAQCAEWQPYMHAASVFESDRRYTYAIVKKPAGFALDNVLSYDSYLQQLDREIQAEWDSH